MSYQQSRVFLFTFFATFPSWISNYGMTYFRSFTDLISSLLRSVDLYVFAFHEVSWIILEGTLCKCEMKQIVKRQMVEVVEVFPEKNRGNIWKILTLGKDLLVWVIRNQYIDQYIIWYIAILRPFIYYIIFYMSPFRDNVACQNLPWQGLDAVVVPWFSNYMPKLKSIT
jgi:hypothetical protein